MANTLSFDVVALDRTAKALESVATRLDKLSAKLDRLDHKRVNVKVTADTRQAERAINRINDRFSTVADTVASRSGLIGVAVVAGLAALPVAAEVAASGVVLAFGAAFATIGIVAAAQSKKVRAIFSYLKTNVVSELEGIAKPFEATLGIVAAVAQSTFDSFAPALKAAFTRMGPTVSLFAADFGKALQQLIPALAPITAAFDALLRSLGRNLPGVFASIAAALSRMSKVVEQNSVAFGDLIAWILKAIPLALNIVTALAKWAATHTALTKAMLIGAVAAGALVLAVAAVNIALKTAALVTTATGAVMTKLGTSTLVAKLGLTQVGTSAGLMTGPMDAAAVSGTRLEAAMRGIGATVAVLTAALLVVQATKVSTDGYAQSIEKAAGANATGRWQIAALRAELAKQQAVVNSAVFQVNGYGLSWSNSGRDLKAAYDRSNALRAEIKRLQDGVASLPPGLQALANAQAKDAAKAQAHAQALQLVIDKLTKLSQQADDAARANLNFKDTVAAAIKTIKQNGKTLDQNTAKGRANANALLDISDAYRQQLSAAVNAGAGTKKVTQIQAQGAVAYEKAARAAGKTTAAIDAYIKKTYGVPGVKVTKLEADKRNAEANLAIVKRKLNDPDLTKTRRAKLEAQKKQLDRAVTAARARLFALTHTNWTVTIQGKYYFTRPPGFIGPVVPHRAAGGPVAQGRSYLVGERGPELLTMGRGGGFVTSSGQTAQAATAPNVDVRVYVGDREITDIVRTEIKTDKRSDKQRAMAGAGRQR